MTVTLPTTLRVGIYGRESKDKTKSVSDQLALGRKVIDGEPGWQMAATYDDGSSASRFARKGRADWSRLLADLAAGKLDVLMLWESSRGSREPVDWFGMLALCRSRGVVIHVISHERTYDPRRARDWKTLAEDGVSSAYETEVTSERVRKGVASAAAAGGVHGRAPFGYERVYDDRTREFIEQRKSVDAPIVVEIFERIARSEPIVSIERDLNARGVPSPEGRQWSRHTIRRLIRNDAYRGQRRHRAHREGEAPTDNRYKAVWPALVSEDLFQRANAVLVRPGRRDAKPGKTKWLLSYLGTSPCGGPLRVQPARPGHNAARYACFADSCVTIAVAETDEIVTRLIVGRLAQPDARDLLTVDDSAVLQARAEAAALRKKLAEARDMWEHDRLSLESFVDMEARLKPRIEDADKRAVPVTAPGALPELLDAATFGVERVRHVWDGLSVAARREVIALLAEVVIGKPTRRLSRSTPEDDRLAEAAARLAGSRWVGDSRTWGELAAAAGV
ncbi:recombinase family protein [Micromonospora sp. NPDC048930]|uniref:recombinase family protein n=1 Tax=Micromonospora sp. NPDC048930 TaxID=3364261 RepID=UPI00370FA331